MQHFVIFIQSAVYMCTIINHKLLICLKFRDELNCFGSRFGTRWKSAAAVLTQEAVPADAADTTSWVLKFKQYVDYNHLLGRGWAQELGVNFLFGNSLGNFMCAFLIGGAFHVQCALTIFTIRFESSSPSIHYYLFFQLVFRCFAVDFG